MLKRLGFSIRDSKSGSWSPPFFVMSRPEAVRSFSDEVNSRNPESMLAKHPEDFTLFCVCEFDVTSGDVVPVGPESLALGANLVREV